jgi:hypothetical protein
MISHIAPRPLRYLPASKRVLAVLAASALCLPAYSAWPQTTATVTVNATSVSAAVPAEGYGVDTAVYDSYLTSSGVASEVQAAGVNALRYPGGSYADIFNFISGTDQTLNGGYFAANATFGNYWMPDLVEPAGAHAIITVNYGSNLNNNGGGQPSEAASWVQYANVTNNYGIVYWEIGNEVYGNGYYSTSLDWEYDLHDTDQTPADRVGNSALSPTAYGTNAAAFIKAMKAVDPNIKCGVFVNTASYYTAWDKDVLSAISSSLNGSGYTLDFVILHWYPSGTNAQILAAQSGIPAQVSQVRSDINNYYTLSNKSSMQILVTESGPGVAGGVYPFLFAADEYLTWFENGISNVEYQELHNGFLESTSSDWTTPYGPWYGVSLDSTVARPGDNMVAATSSNSLLRAHAINRADGKVGVVLVNEDPTNSTSVSVSVSNATLSTSGTEYKFGNGNFSSGSSTANSGISTSSIGGVGNNFTVTVPAYSATAIVIPVSSCAATAITPYIQVNSGTWEEEATATVASGSTVNLGPQPSSGGSWHWSGPNGYTSTSRQISAIPLSSGANSYVATYTNSCGAQSTETFTITVSGSSTLIPNGTYIVTAVNSGLAIDDPGYSTTEGEDMEIYTVNDGANQQWTVNNLGNNVITLTNVSSGQLLDVAGASKSSGALVDQWPANGQTNQEWNVISLGGGSYELTSVNSGLALSVIGGGTSSGTGIDQLTYSGNTWQQWKFTSY